MTRSIGSTSRYRRGYSLIELMLVLAICAVLLALALPRLGAAADRWAVRTATAEVEALFATAREEAIANRAMVAVVIDSAAAQVTVRSRGVPLLTRAEGAIHGVHVAGSRDSMSYDARGIGYGAANLSVYVKRGGAAETLFVSRLGRVRF